MPHWLHFPCFFPDIWVIGVCLPALQRPQEERGLGRWIAVCLLLGLNSSVMNTTPEGPPSSVSDGVEVMIDGVDEWPVPRRCLLGLIILHSAACYKDDAVAGVLLPGENNGHNDGSKLSLDGRDSTWYFKAYWGVPDNNTTACLPLCLNSHQYRRWWNCRRVQPPF